MKNGIKELARLWESIVPGESVLAEYDSLVLPYKGFHYLVSWAREKGYHIFIIDVLDTLYLYKTQIQLAGLDANLLDSVDVIKIGGRLNVGISRARLPANDVPKLLKEFDLVYNSHLSEIECEKSIVIVLGLSKLLLLAKSKFEGLMIIDLLIKYTGTQRKTTFYFVNIDVLENSSHYLVPLLEELATTVIKVTRARRGDDTEPYVYVKVVKAVNAEVEGIKIKL